MPHKLAWHDLEFGRFLGEGQSGRVYDAQVIRDIGDLPKGTRVAVKKYKSKVLEAPGEADRINLEDEVGRTLTHPNVMRTHGIVFEPTHGSPALVMQFYEGRTLEDVLNECRNTPTKRLDIVHGFSLIRGIASGLTALHGRGVIHRDIKPSNIILSSDGPVVGDLGVLRTSDFAEQTTTGAFLGTIRYAAPEYLFGETYDNDVDVYSLGAIAYEIFTNTRHFGRWLHWALLVVAKKSEPEHLQHDDLEAIAQIANLNTCSFIRAFIDSSRCAAHERTLSLEAAISAIDQRLWDGPFRFSSGSFAKGMKTFADRFGDAANAARVLRRELAPTDYNVACRILRERYWRGWIPRYELDNDLTAELVRLGVIESATTARRQNRVPDQAVVAPSVLEAYSLGLLA
jgi:serine/threonine protein kinase